MTLLNSVHKKMPLDTLQEMLVPIVQFFDALATRTRNWTMREWLSTGVLLQIVLLVLYQLILWIIPEKEEPPLDLSLSAEMTFVEFQEQVAQKTTQTKDLSDKIIEQDKMPAEEPINWDNAADPATDASQRYNARLLVNISPDDYPSRARRASIGQVVVAVTLYIRADGRIGDVKIRKIRSVGDSAKPFEKDFILAVRKILLQKTRLLSSPFNDGHGARDFIWDTTVTFTLQ